MGSWDKNEILVTSPLLLVISGVSIKFEVGSQFEKVGDGIDKGPLGSFFNYFNLGRK